MSSLADELLQDFEDSENEEEDDQLQSFIDGGNDGSHNGQATKTEGMDVDEAGDGDAEMVELSDGDDEEATKAKVEKMQLGGIQDVRAVAGLMKTLEPVLEKIAQFQALPPEKRTTHVGNVEDNPEYHLLTEANTLSTQIDSEIILVSKFIRDHYSTRFPELETLISNPLDYAKAVAVIGNGPMDNIRSLASSGENLIGQPLKSVLDGPTLMVVTVEATTTRGRDLSQPELERVLTACQMTLQLDNSKKILTEYVQSRMNLFAPNLTALIGSLTAAQLLNFAGGLTGLAKTPACNIPPLGSKKQAQAGLATNVGLRHQGFLFHSPLITALPSDLKQKGMRIVSAKLILAARVDRVHESPDGSVGENLKSACLDRLDKLTEAAPNRGPKALPAPDDKPARKRGGRRARKAKEAVAMTDLRKAQNRMAFGQEEKEVGYGTGDSTKGLGMIGMGNEGRIRGLQIDQRTRAKLSAKSKGWGGATPLGGTASSLRGFGSGTATVLRGGTSVGASGLRTAGVGGSSGTTSTIAFTPVQGLELADPAKMAALKRKRQEEEDRWFKGGTFTQVGGAASTNQNGSNSGFKLPGPPPGKKVDTGSGKP